MKPVALVLGDFLPYRLSVLSNRVSGAIAGLYAERFAINMPQWRVMAVLGEQPGLTATELTALTAMDKVAVTRAVKSLVAAGRLRREASPTDGRAAHLRLTAKGEKLYARIAPLALAFEGAVLEGLSERERKQLDSILDKLARRIDEVHFSTNS
jgi:DNA-binding MarR family transcriptional regulator